MVRSVEWRVQVVGQNLVHNFCQKPYYTKGCRAMKQTEWWSLRKSLELGMRTSRFLCLFVWILWDSHFSHSENMDSDMEQLTVLSCRDLMEKELKCFGTMYYQRDVKILFRYHSKWRWGKMFGLTELFCLIKVTWEQSLAFPGPPPCLGLFQIVIEVILDPRRASLDQLRGLWGDGLPLFTILLTSKILCLFLLLFRRKKNMSSVFWNVDQRTNRQY